MDDLSWLHIAGWIDSRRNTIWRCLKNEVRSLVGCLRLPCTYLPLVAYHWLVCTVLIRDELPFITWWTNHRVEGLITMVLRR